MKASYLKEGQSGRIESLNLPKNLKLRLMELGFRKGMVISVFKKLGNNFMIKIFSSNPIALSKDILDKISVIVSSV